ncbi:MAG: hypothetical protein ACREOU_15720 [Candidatus Eiseniibacteriota bacterium]
MRPPARSPLLALLGALATAGLLAFAAGCSHNDTSTLGPTTATPRTWRMGFSGFPPSPDLGLALAALEMWTGRRSDAALLHIDPPWDTLLAGFPADDAVRIQHQGIVNYYRAKRLDLTITVDVTNGLDRSAEHPALVRLGRSIAEPEVQQRYVEYVMAIDTILAPTHLVLAAETNLIQVAAPAPVYTGVVQMTNTAAESVRVHDANVRLSVSVQVEVAWGRLGVPGPPVYAGIARDIADFPFAQEFALSSYPYLGGFAEPEDVPLDYYSRIRMESGRPVLVVEGGWTSESVGGIVSSAAKQARYLRRQAQILDQAQAVAVFQISFTDLASSLFSSLPPSTALPYFTRIGLVDTLLAPKPALATWDSAFARPRR